jgi:hypothetical protein
MQNGAYPADFKQESPHFKDYETKPQKHQWMQELMLLKQEVQQLRAQAELSE